jgi:hypothetical protein
MDPKDLIELDKVAARRAGRLAGDAFRLMSVMHGLDIALLASALRHQAMEPAPPEAAIAGSPHERVAMMGTLMLLGAADALAPAPAH